NPQQVQALLAGWYDLVGPQVGGGGPWGHRGPYGGQWAAGVNPYMRIGADAPVGPPMPMPPPMPPMPSAPPAPPMPPSMHPHHMHPHMFAQMQDSFAYPPRAAVVDAPLPTQANRDILP